MPMHHGTTEAQYNAMDGLRSSTINAVLDSPARYQHSLDTPATSKTFTLGSATHSMALEDGKTVLLVELPDPDHQPEEGHEDDDPPLIPITNWRTKAAQKARDNALNEGLYPLTLPEFQHARAMSDAITAHPDVAPHLAAGHHESAITGIDPATFARMKARLDILDIEARTIVDLKTIASANPRDFSSHAYRYGYHVQAVHYIAMAAQATGTDPDEWTFLFALVEKDAPYLHTDEQLRAAMTREQMAAQHLTHVTPLNAEFLNIGWADRRHGIETYLDCRRTGVWPAYLTQITETPPPTWALARH